MATTTPPHTGTTSGPNGRAEDRSLTELMGDMSQDVSLLMRKEVELAREEIKVELRKAARAGAAFGAAGYLALLVGTGLVLTLGFLLAEVMPTWVAFLIVTLALGAGAAVAGWAGRRQTQDIDPVPEVTIETLKEDKQWLSEQRS